MSDARAIAATTATLRVLLLRGIPVLDPDLSDLTVSIQPLNTARNGSGAAQLNLFLYETTVNAAWRNLDTPYQVRPGETAQPPLALNLRYLLTAWGRDDADVDAIAHRLFGSALSILHDHPVLGREEIRMAFAGSDLPEQFERVRLTPLPLSLEEITKLWTAAQAPYRLSVAFEATVILIDSHRPTRSALPVLRRGSVDRGAHVSVGSAPRITQIRLPFAQPAARLGENVVIVGESLRPEGASVRFTHLRLGSVVDLAASAGAESDQLSVHLPDETEDVNALSRWAPGFYSLAIVTGDVNGPALVSNEVAVSLAPRIVVNPTAVAAGTIALTVSYRPRVVAGQRVQLLFGDRQVSPDNVNNTADLAQPTTLTFTITNVAAGTYVVRLRVDGGDSIPVVMAGTPLLPAFDPAQQVVVT